MKAYTLDRARTPGTIDALNAFVQEFGFAAIPDAVLARIDVPTTLIWGRNDANLPLEVGRRASERYGWSLEVIENAGNEPAIEQPDAFLRALRAAMGRGDRA
jgi:pimeloyl-ACP methyl ester carboxylesterase